MSGDEPRRIALEMSFNWFEYHARQRMEMFKFHWVLAAAVISGFGVSWQIKFPMGTLICGLSLVIISILFWKIDRRSESLVKHGEVAILHYWSELGLQVDKCPVTMSDVKNIGEVRFKQAIGVTYYLTGLFGSLMVILSVLSR